MTSAADKPDEQIATISPAMFKALRKAAWREYGNICPVVGIYGNAETALLHAMDERGFIAWDNQPWNSAPRISEAGRAIVKAAQS